MYSKCITKYPDVIPLYPPFWSLSGTKETAFIYAIMAAGLVHSVTRACSAGNMTECSCDSTLTGSGSQTEGWHWGGCSDDIAYGTWFSRRFIDHATKNASTQGDEAMLIMNQHNSEAGRQVREGQIVTTQLVSILEQQGGQRLKISQEFKAHNKKAYLH